MPAPQMIDHDVTPAALQLAQRWYGEDGFQDRIGYLASRIMSTYQLAVTTPAYKPILCSQAELDEYRAYVVHARMVGFLEEWLAGEALDACDATQARLDGVA